MTNYLFMPVFNIYFVSSIKGTATAYHCTSGANKSINHVPMKSSAAAAQRGVNHRRNYFVDIETDRDTDKRSEKKVAAF